MDYGLISGIECRFVKTDPELIDAIAVRTGMESTFVKIIMRYNIFTIKQFSSLSMLSTSTILNKTRVSQIDGKIGTELDFCYPFPSKSNKGPKFILRNEKSEKYLK